MRKMKECFIQCFIFAQSLSRKIQALRDSVFDVPEAPRISVSKESGIRGTLVGVQGD